MVDRNRRRPVPLTYAGPERRRSFDELLTDFVVGELADGRLGRPLPLWSRLLILALLLIAAVATAAVLFA